MFFFFLGLFALALWGIVREAQQLLSVTINVNSSTTPSFNNVN